MRRHYGESPVHLLAHLVLLPLMLWAILTVADFRDFGNVVVWFVAGLVLHDLVLLPAYSTLDTAAQRVRLRGVPAINFIRFPAAISLLVGAVYFGTLSGRSDRAFAFVSGTQHEGYVGRYLLMVAVLFGLAAVLLAVRVRAAGADAPRR